MQGSFPKKELWERRAEGTEGVGVGGGVTSLHWGRGLKRAQKIFSILDLK